MVACSVTEECPVAVSAELLWKVFLSGGDTSILAKACVGIIDDIQVEGDGGPGTVTTMKLNPAAGGADVFKAKLLARDAAARVVRSEMIPAEGANDVAAKLKSQVSEVKVTPAGKGACVCKVTVEYETLDGTPLTPEEQATMVLGYIGLVKKVEEYIIAHTGEVA